MMTWQKRRFIPKIAKEKTRGLLVSGALAGWAILSPRTLPHLLLRVKDLLGSESIF